MNNLGIIFYGLIIIVIGSIVNAFVISHLWRWILVPSFNIDEITMAVAFGLSVIVGFFRERKKTNKDEDSVEILTKAFSWTLFNAAFYLSIGWIAYLFI